MGYKPLRDVSFRILEITEHVWTCVKDFLCTSGLFHRGNTVGSWGWRQASWRQCLPGKGRKGPGEAPRRSFPRAWGTLPAAAARQGWRQHRQRVPGAATQSLLVRAGCWHEAAIARHEPRSLVLAGESEEVSRWSLKTPIDCPERNSVAWIQILPYSCLLCSFLCRNSYPNLQGASITFCLCLSFWLALLCHSPSDLHWKVQFHFHGVYQQTATQREIVEIFKEKRNILCLLSLSAIISIVSIFKSLSPQTSVSQF